MELDAESKRIVFDLKSTGIAISTLQELFPSKASSLLEEFVAFTTRTESLVKNVKTYLLNYWEQIPALDWHNPFLRFSLEPQLLSIAQHYMGMWPRLNYYHLAKALPVGDAKPTASQNWHRDPEEKRMLKVFVYLNDVNEDGGPFMFIPESTRNLKYGLWPLKDRPKDRTRTNRS
jgi:hypothetical protein